MPGNKDIKSVDEIEDRIADILGYCQQDGRLHNPWEFKKSILRSKWSCPNCSKDIGKVDFKKASELQWVISDRHDKEEQTRVEDEEEPEEDEPEDEEQEEDEE